MRGWCVVGTVIGRLTDGLSDMQAHRILTSVCGFFVSGMCVIRFNSGLSPPVETILGGTVADEQNTTYGIHLTSLVVQSFTSINCLLSPTCQTTSCAHLELERRTVQRMVRRDLEPGH